MAWPNINVKYGENWREKCREILKTKEKCKRKIGEIEDEMQVKKELQFFLCVRVYVCACMQEREREREEIEKREREREREREEKQTDRQTDR